MIRLHAEGGDKAPKGLNPDGTVNKRSKIGQQAMALKGDGRTVANAMARQIVHGPMPPKAKANPRVVSNTFMSRQKGMADTVNKDKKKKANKGNNLNRGK